MASHTETLGVNESRSGTFTAKVNRGATISLSADSAAKVICKDCGVFLSKDANEEQTDGNAANIDNSYGTSCTATASGEFTFSYEAYNWQGPGGFTVSGLADENDSMLSPNPLVFAWEGGTKTASYTPPDGKTVEKIEVSPQTGTSVSGNTISVTLSTAKSGWKSDATLMVTFSDGTSEETTLSIEQTPWATITISPNPVTMKLNSPNPTSANLAVTVNCAESGYDLTGALYGYMSGWSLSGSGSSWTLTHPGDYTSSVGLAGYFEVRKGDLVIVEDFKVSAYHESDINVGIAVDPPQMIFPPDGGSKSFNIVDALGTGLGNVALSSLEGYYDGNGAFIETGSANRWLDASFSVNALENTVTCGANDSGAPRYGVVRFFTSAGTAELPVTQLADDAGGTETARIDIIPDEVYFDSAGGSQRVSFELNEWNAAAEPTYSVRISDSWISWNNGIVTASANPDTTQRSGEIVFTVNESGNRTVLRVNQTDVPTTEEFFYISPTQKTLDSAAQSFSMNYSLTAGTVSVVSSDAWISAGTFSYPGESVLISVEENTGNTARTGTIVFRADDIAGQPIRTLTITQDAAATPPPPPGEPSVSAAPNTLSFPSAGGTQTVAVSSSADAGTIATETSGDWIHADPSGEITVAANTNGNPRTGIVLFHAENGESAEVAISQEAARATPAVLYRGIRAK